jgi:hypothetical protein
MMKKTMKKSMTARLTLLALACCIAGAAHAAGQETQAVHDKDVFEQNKVILLQSTANTKAVSDLNTTVKNAVTRTKTMGGVASTKDLRIAIPDDADTDAAIAATYAKVKEMGCAKTGKDGSKMPADQLEVCQKIEKSAYDMVAMLRANLKRSKERATVIDSLLAELDKTGPGNLKETADLSARIQVETALLQNEKVMMDMAIAKSDQQMRLYNQLLVALEDDSKGDASGNKFSLKK